MAHKEMIFLKGFAKGKSLFNFLKMIIAATELHQGQTRKSGEPYIEHPMRVASILVSLGIEDDATLAAAIGHDVFEDCDINPAQLSYAYGIEEEPVKLMQALTKSKETSTKHYYDGLKKDQRLILVKLADRCHNISTMVGSFTVEKMKAYVKETEEYVLDLCKYGIEHYPERSDVFYALKYHIESVMKAVTGFTQMLESK